MEHLPVFLNLRGEPCLVVGGGVVGARRAALLLEAGARVTVVAPRLCRELTERVERDEVDHRARGYRSDDLAGQRLVVGATDDRELNGRVSAEAQALGLPVNVVDAPSLCSFIMPAIVDRGPVTIAVSTGGASPVLARLTRGRLEAVLPSNYGCLAELAGRHRQAVKERVPDPADRRRLWERALDGRVGALALAGRIEEAERELEALLAGDVGSAVTRIAVVFGGDGDVQQLSLRALARLGAADLVVHPAAGLEAVVGLSRRDSERMLVEHGASRDELLSSAARRLRASEPLGMVCVVVPGHADAVLEAGLAELGSHGELEVVQPAPR